MGRHHANHSSRDPTTREFATHDFPPIPADLLSVGIRSGLLDRIAEHVRRLGASGLEAGGFLLGTRQPRESNRTILTIDEFCPLRSEIRNGRLLEITDSNSVVLEHQLRSCGDPRRVIGFLRSNLRPETGLSDSDITLMTRHLSPESIFVIVTGSSELAGTVYVPDPFDPTGFRAAYRLSFARPPADRVIDKQSLPEVPAFFERPALSKDRWLTGRAVLLSISGMVLVVLIILIALQSRTIALLNRDNGQSAAASAGLDLKTDRIGSENRWRISWSRSAPSVRTASKGRMSIRDGYSQRDLELTADDIRSGSIIYAPLSNDVTFRLELLDLERNRSVSESIRVLDSSWPAYPDLLASAGQARSSILQPQSGVPHAAAGQPIGNRPTNEKPSAGINAGGPAAVSSSLPEGDAEPETKPLRTFTPPKPPVIVNRTVNDLPAPPEPVVTAGQDARALALFQPTSPPPPATPFRPVPEHAAPSSGLRPAKLLHKVDPVYSTSFGPTSSFGTVRVEGTIGVDGRVHEARATLGSPLLRGPALAAIKQWIYEPASINGHPISLPIVIELRPPNN